MANTFKQDLSESMRMYREHVSPIIGELIRGEMRVVEGDTTEETALLLDRYAGVDIFCIRDWECSIAGIASRIQHGRNWRTFTVRKSRDSGAKTEYEKRVHQIENGLMYPTFTYQAYVDGGRLVGLGVCRTVDLIEYITLHDPPVRRTGFDKNGQATFYVVEWDEMRRAGYRVLEHDGKARVA